MKSYNQIKKTIPKTLLFGLGTVFFLILILGTASGLRDIVGQSSTIPLYYGIFCIVIHLTTWALMWREGGTRHTMGTRITHLLNSMLILTISQVIYGVGLIIGDIVGLIKPQYSIIINIIGGILSLIFISMGIYGVIRGKGRYTIHNIRVPISNLPEAFDGYKIVQISDVHAGSLYNPKDLQKGINLINKQDADLFVFTGDLVNNSADEFDQRKEIFGQINAKDGKFSILGNHDYGEYISRPSPEAKEDNMKKLQQHHKDIGWKLLLNSHHSLQKDGQHIALVGIQNRGDGFSQYGDLDEAVEGIHPDEITILLSHDPTHRAQRVRYYDKKMVHLTLSGHTHGMQMGIDLPWYKRSPIQRRYKYRIGLYEDNGRQLYVNRGFGVLGLNARIGMRPEITVIELKKK